jgi:hypothetical protein
VSPADDEPISLAARAIERLALSDAAKDALRAILAELAAQYQQSFVKMLETQRMQASALDRLQTTLHLLVEKIAPEIKDRIPIPIRLASDEERPDLTSAVVVADPIATGYTLSQANLAEALQLPQADVSVLVRAFGIIDDGDCAVIVRKGPRLKIANYHPRSLDRFRACVSSPPGTLDAQQKRALNRVRRRLAKTQP